MRGRKHLLLETQKTGRGLQAKLGLAQPEICLNAQFEGILALLIQSDGPTFHESSPGDVGQHRTRPHAQRVPEDGGGRIRAPSAELGTALLNQLAEDVRVQLPGSIRRI